MLNNLALITLLPPGEEGENQASIPVLCLRTRRPVPWRRPRRARLPWLRCPKCLTRLARMDVVDGRTCVWGDRAPSFRMDLTCPRCGKVREFVSMPVS